MPGAARSLKARPLLVVPACAAALQACVPYPVYKTTQAAHAFEVVDEQGAPVAGATVTVTTISYPYGFPQKRETRTTDAAGAANVPRESEWRIESLMIHGAEAFRWDWCVDAPGKAGRRGGSWRSYRNSPDAVAPDARGILRVVLAAGDSERCDTRPIKPRGSQS